MVLYPAFGRGKGTIFVHGSGNMTLVWSKISFFTKALEYLTLLQEIPDISIDDVRFGIYNDDSKKIKTRTFDTGSGLMFGNLGRNN